MGWRSESFCIVDFGRRSPSDVGVSVGSVVTGRADDFKRSSQDLFSACNLLRCEYGRDDHLTKACGLPCNFLL